MSDVRRSSVVYSDEMTVIRTWMEALLVSSTGSLATGKCDKSERLVASTPFSFHCGGKSSTDNYHEYSTLKQTDFLPTC